MSGPCVSEFGGDWKTGEMEVYHTPRFYLTYKKAEKAATFLKSQGAASVRIVAKR